MINLPFPTIRTENYILSLFENFRYKEKKDRFISITPLILQLEQDYVEKAQTQSLHLISSGNPLHPFVSKEEMMKLYTEKFVGGSGRSCYDDLLEYQSNSYFERYNEKPHCPYCNSSQVNQIDHFLPKSLYPAYAVSAVNLIPSCSFCNEEKSNLSAEQSFLHPYFDNIMHLEWLNMEIRYFNNLVRFYYKVVIPEDAIDNSMYYTDNLNRQLSTLRLRSRYNLKAVQLTSTQKNLFRRRLSRGEEFLREYFEEQLEVSENISKNSAEAVYYRTLLKIDDPEELRIFVDHAQLL